MSELREWKRWPWPFELALQLVEVVDLAVGDDLDVAGLVEDRLLPAREIDDGEAAHAEADAGQRDAALFVRAAMVQHPHHAREIVGADRPIEIPLDDADDAAHLIARFRLGSGSRRSRVTFAGIPVAIENSGISPTTTAPAPMMASRPMVDPSVTTTCVPSHVPSPTSMPRAVRPCCSTGMSMRS